ncbi:MAG: hypothetical protein DHS20C20_06620 [Ardenticatenaceae bacterium]|nr:MAG: hypothetical protein DHS20C20_06620 [Ardenticatenaceae bacterium]
MAHRQNERFWYRLKKRIQRGKVTPIIGDRVGHSGFVSSNELVQAWAAEVGYPMANTRSITRVAQYCSITDDPLGAKEDYLDFLKNQLLNHVREHGNNSDEYQDFLDTLEDELDDISFSEMARRLKYPDFSRDDKNPLKILASFPIPVYITTNYHSFLTRAIEEKKGQPPRIEVCPWNHQGGYVSFDEQEYEDDPNRPIVYYLHGIDQKMQESSLVLTEDDYLDFLVAIAQDPEIIPNRIREALSDSTLLLMGFQLQDWDFRVLFRGLIKERPSNRSRIKSVCIQVEPDDYDKAKDIERYLETYFQQHEFDVYWGDAESFTQELWENLGQL